jgi:hypothetical protein
VRGGREEREGREIEGREREERAADSKGHRDPRLELGLESELGLDSRCFSSNMSS